MCILTVEIPYAACLILRLFIAIAYDIKVGRVIACWRVLVTNRFVSAKTAKHTMAIHAHEPNKMIRVYCSYKHQAGGMSAHYDRRYFFVRSHFVPVYCYFIS